MTTTSMNTTMATTEEDTINCPICYDVIGNIDVNYMSTSCGHKFHSACVLKNVTRNGFSCPYCRQNMIEEDNVTEVRNVHNEGQQEDDSVVSNDTESESESEADPIMEVLNNEHTAARSIGLPSPYDFCVELQSRYDVHMIDLMRIILSGDLTRRALISQRDLRAYQDIISSETSISTFDGLKENMLHLIQEYRRERQEESQRHWNEIRELMRNGI